jgi:hypothetical protein
MAKASLHRVVSYPYRKYNRVKSVGEGVKRRLHILFPSNLDQQTKKVSRNTVVSNDEHTGCIKTFITI